MRLARYSQRIALAAILAATAAASAPAKSDGDSGAALRAAAAKVLATRRDSGSLATAAALTWVDPPSRSKADIAKAAAGALELADQATELAPDNPAIGWLRLEICAEVPACDIRDAATTLRWVDAENGAAWLPILAVAQKDRDRVEIDRIVTDMAQGQRFDLYGNRVTVMIYDALQRARAALPPKYLGSDLVRLTEALDITASVVVPSLSPLVNACRDATRTERREACLRLSKTMQRGDAIMAQLVGFAVEKRLTSDAKELRIIAERRRVLEWRSTMANQADTPLLPWLRNASARSRLAKLRALPREEDVSMALLREHHVPLEPPEDRR